MTRQVRFSVVMNVYNGAPYLHEAIGSVLAQKFTDWELILWDDCSTDNSAAICQEYQDPRVRVLTQERNGGLGHARNGAVAAARGEWVAFLDQDDIWTPDKLRRQNALIEADRTGRLALVYGRTMRFNAAGLETPFDPWFAPGKLPEGEIFSLLLAKPSFIALSSAAFRTDVLRALGPVPARIRFCTDYYLSLMVSRRHTTACVQTACCRYRVHEASMTHVFRRPIHEEILSIVEQAAQPAHQRIVRRRRQVHETWIGLEQFRAGHRRAGLARILRSGSVAYLALRPLLVQARAWRGRMGARP